MLNVPRVALYARFSSDNQRTESIDAQLRAMKQYCGQQHWQIVMTYIDEAKSATSDKRPDFQSNNHSSEQRSIYALHCPIALFVLSLHLNK
jgi:site-specific DNA recombinase